MSVHIESSRVRLRTLNDDDLSLVYEWRNRKDFIELFSSHQNFVTYSQFLREQERDSKRERHIQCAVERVRDGKVIGLVYDYVYSRTNGFTFMGGYIASEYQNIGYGALGAALFIKFLFRSFDLRKIYTEVLGSNPQSLKLVRGIGFLEEGRFIKHRLVRGVYHDVFRFALYPSSLEVIDKLSSQRKGGD